MMLRLTVKALYLVHYMRGSTHKFEIILFASLHKYERLKIAQGL
jgi:hypothetical protein